MPHIVVDGVAVQRTYKTKKRFDELARLVRPGLPAADGDARSRNPSPRRASSSNGPGTRAPGLGAGGGDFCFASTTSYMPLWLQPWIYCRYGLNPVVFNIFFILLYYIFICVLHLYYL